MAAADLDYDFRNDLVLAGSGGVQIFRQNEKGGFTAITNRTKLPRDVIAAPMRGVWPADVDTDGDLDLVLARRDAPPLVLRNNGDSTFPGLPSLGNYLSYRTVGSIAPPVYSAMKASRVWRARP